MHDTYNRHAVYRTQATHARGYQHLAYPATPVDALPGDQSVEAISAERIAVYFR